MLRKKRLQWQKVIPGCTTWCPRPQKLRKEPLALLEDITFYPLTEKEGMRFGRRRLASVIVGHMPFPSWVKAKRPKKKQQHLSISNVAELAQFKDVLHKKKESEVDILVLLVYPGGMGRTFNHSTHMVVRRSDQTLATRSANQIVSMMALRSR